MRLHLAGKSKHFLCLVVTAAALALTTWLPAKDTAGKKPNVLFIAIDDLNDWTSSLAGHPQAITPNIDRLAGRGVLFTNAHCAAPACNPSRAALMTGIRPATSGIYTNPQRWRLSPVLSKAATMPQHFMAHGYKAIGSGKIYHGSFPDPASWEDYWPSQTRNKPGDPAPKGRPLDGIPRTAHFDWGPVKAPTTAMGDWQVADWITGQLSKKHDRPLFLACGFYRPHLPWYAPQKYFDKFPLDKIKLPNVKEDDLDDVPPLGQRMAKPQGDHARVLKHKQWRQAVQGYLASIHFVDDCVGQVIGALDKRDDTDRWIVVLWSDHRGWHLGEKLHWRKFSLWEEATHNQLMIVAPGVTSPGGQCEEPVNLLDIYPTLIDLCGLKKKPELDGLSLLPQLKNPKAERAVPSLTTHGRGNHSLRSKAWRYIRYSDGTEELYDHSKDPMEWKNLAGDSAYAERKSSLARHLPKEDAPHFPVKGKRRSKGKKRVSKARQ